MLYVVVNRDVLDERIYGFQLVKVIDSGQCDNCVIVIFPFVARVGDQRM